MTKALDRMTDKIVLKEFGLVIGLIQIPGAGQRVASWDGYESRHMSAAAARRFAADIIIGDESRALKPVHDALMTAAEKVEAKAHG